MFFYLGMAVRNTSFASGAEVVPISAYILIDIPIPISISISVAISIAFIVVSRTLICSKFSWWVTPSHSPASTTTPSPSERGITPLSKFFIAQRY